MCKEELEKQRQFNAELKLNLTRLMVDNKDNQYQQELCELKTVVQQKDEQIIKLKYENQDITNREADLREKNASLAKQLEEQKIMYQK